MMNYHELTMNEPRDSPHRRQQSLVICTIILSIVVYDFLQAGIFHPVNIMVPNGEGETTTTTTKSATLYFPGGDYIYKSTKRDYAATMSLTEFIIEDINDHQDDIHTATTDDATKDTTTTTKRKKTKLKLINKKHTIDQMYNIFLDNPDDVHTGYQRFTSGYLTPSSSNDNHNLIRKIMLHRNEVIQLPTRKEVAELPAHDLWERLKYKQITLPKVPALVLNFPYTNGVSSILLFQYKVYPALYAKATEYFQKQQQQQQQQNSGTADSPLPPIVILSTCSTQDSICTYYVPIVDPTTFLLGQVPTLEYAKTLPIEKFLDFDKDKKRVKRFFIRMFMSSSNKNQTTIHDIKAAEEEEYNNMIDEL